MKKIWSYIAVFLAGISTMAIIALKWFAGDDYSLEIKKIKNKNSSGDVIVPIQVEVAKKSRKERKEDRKAARLDKKKLK